MTRKNFRSNYNIAFVFLIALMIVVGCFRICSTYTVFWQTWDEAYHIAAGMEWLDKGQYTYERFHPPLARVMSALGLYLNGIRGVDNLSSPWVEGNAILQSGGTYERNLILARIGILPFFVIASLVVALWAKNYGGITTSLLATSLFTTLPIILAHSTFATLDMACAALVSAALFTLTLWLSKPTVLRSSILGISIGLAMLTKLSAIVFFILPGSLIIAMYSIRFFRKKSIKNLGSYKFKQWIIASVIALLLCALTISAGYRFSYDHLWKAENRPHETVDRIVGSKGIFHDISYFILENTPIPAPEFRQGIADLSKRSEQGHLVYLLGNITKKGWWYFYPIIILVKTPLPFLLLSVLGFLLIFKDIFRVKESFELLVPIIAFISILAFGMSSSVNNGLRQLLIIYPLLAIVAGYGAFKLLSFQKKFKFVGLGLVTVLFSWQLISSFAAHPDYLSYFNELAGNHPEEIVMNSDVDWGQDLKRLTKTLKKREIKNFKILYNGSDGINLNQFNLPVIQKLQPYQRETGWIAISIYHLKLGTRKAPYDQFSWLKEYQPVERVGKSILLYYIPKN